MKKPQHDAGPFTLPDGKQVKAVYPLIVSASRATDIPAYFSKWFVNRLRDGHCLWTNPFNANQTSCVAFEKTRAIVFWSKNPKPLIEHLPEIDARGLGYYFQFTVNDYERENLEPNVPPLAMRIETFHGLAQMIGPERVIWRFDPLILSDALSVTELLERAERLADELHGATRKLVFSFGDIEVYRKVRNNLNQTGQRYREFTPDEMDAMARGMRKIGERHKMEIATCAEKIDLGKYGILHNSCIDDELLAKLYPQDKALMDFFGRGRKQNDLFGTNVQPIGFMKDSGQREECGCVISKDIGSYNTCPHLCSYCYANASETAVKNRFKFKDDNSALLCGG